MSPPVMLYRFRVQWNDVDRAVYESVDFRLAMHPSESFSFLLTRLFAYLLNFQDGLVFSDQGLADPDEPCLSMPDPRGGLALWIEVGSPSARRLHKAAKASTEVKVYTYKNPEALLKEVAAADVFQAKKIEFYSLTSDFLEELEVLLGRDNQWTILHDGGTLTVSKGDNSFHGELHRHRFQ